MEIKCAYTELVDVSKLIPNPKNNNKHPIDQIKRLAKIIDFQGQRSPIVVSNRSGFIVKGHGRLEAIKLLGWEKCAVDYQDYDSEAQEYADMTADNEIAKWAEFQTDMFLEEIKGLDIDQDYFGLKEMPELGIEEEQDTIYETKIKTPVYEITGEEPKLNELVNTEKADKLKEEIEKSNLPNKVKEFLKLTATRLYEFNYSKIAEYYAHQDKDLQDIMEKLALVIIDYNKAVEYGFVEMTKQIDALVDMGGEDEE
jgi:phage regulator Rha-like protein